MCRLKFTSALSAVVLCAAVGAGGGACADTDPTMAQAKATTTAIPRRCRFIAEGYAQRFGSSIICNMALTRFLIVLALLWPCALDAQTKPAQPSWTTPRTPDGQPDLQGVWTNATLTPFERPASMAGKPFLTEAEAAAIALQQAQVAMIRSAGWRRSPRYWGAYFLMTKG